MFSREEAKRIKKEFWVTFGKTYPKKWLLYNTKIKGFSFKFIAEQKKAGVTLDIEPTDQTQRELLFEQVLSLKNILETDFFPDIIFEQDYVLENGKTISRIHIEYPQKFSVYNKNHWQDCYVFLNKQMSLFESFWEDYKEYIEQAVI